MSKYCSKVKYVLKVDDDVFVNLYSLLNYLDNLKLETSNNVLCYFQINSPVQRELNSKFYVSYFELNKTYYPKYCDVLNLLLTTFFLKSVMLVLELKARLDPSFVHFLCC